MFKKVPKGPKQVEVTRSNGCCSCFGKFICCLIIGVLLLLTAVCSVIAGIICRFQFWTYVNDANAKGGPLTIRTGWLEYTRTASSLNITSLSNTGNSSIATTTSEIFQTPSQLLAAGSPSLRDISWDFLIIGYICIGVLAVSLVLSLFLSLMACCGKAGKHVCCLGIPMGIIVIGIMLAYYLCALFKIRDYTFGKTGTSYTPVPDFGWVLGVVAGILWLVSAGASTCVPSTTHTDWVEVQSPEGAMVRPQSPGYNNDVEMSKTNRRRR